MHITLKGGVAIRFKMLIIRGKMPLPLPILGNGFQNSSWSQFVVGVASSHDICMLRF
jgi:hypothetical protein